MLPSIHTVTVKGASTHALAADRKTQRSMAADRGTREKRIGGIGKNFSQFRQGRCKITHLRSKWWPKLWSTGLTSFTGAQIDGTFVCFPETTPSIPPECLNLKKDRPWLMGVKISHNCRKNILFPFFSRTFLSRLIGAGGGGIRAFTFLSVR